MKHDLREIKRNLELNRRERMKFIEFTVDWMKRTPNKVWSKQHADFINSVLRSANHTKKDLKMYMGIKKKFGKA